MAAPAPEPSCVLRGHTASVQCVSFANAELLASGSETGEVRIWDMSTRRARSVFAAGDDKGVLHVQWLASDAASLLTQGKGGTVRVWDTEANKPTWEMETQAFSFCRVALLEPKSPSSLLVAPCSESAAVDVWDVRADKPVQRLHMEGAETGIADSKFGMVMCARFATVGEAQQPHVGVGGEGGQLAVFDLRSSKCVGQGRVQPEPVLSFDWNLKQSRHVKPKKRKRGEPMLHGVAGGASARVQGFCCDFASGLVEPTDDVTLPAEGVSSVCVRDDQRLFACGGWDHRVRLFSTKAGFKPLAVLRYHTGTVHDVAFAPGDDCKWMATASKDTRVAVYSIYG